MKKKFLLFLFLFTALSVGAQTENAALENALKQYFQQYRVDNYRPANTYKLTRLEVDEASRTISVYTDEAFAAQPFSPQNVKHIYSSMSRSLAPPYNAYTLRIYALEKEISTLIPNNLLESPDPLRTWKGIASKEYPWVKNASRPASFAGGMEGRHIAVWASHGRYFKNEQNSWIWQRPKLFCTSEDLFTQTFVVPYLIPMLENSGAVVYTPRERDWQPLEIIVDNDNPNKNGTYRESSGNKAVFQGTQSVGFALDSTVLIDGQNPFTLGTARQTSTTTRRTGASSFWWIPRIEKSGTYAVYVSYRSVPGSISDAKYSVHHNGGVTHFRVNQKMGGGTWVYLGTFFFEEGESTRSCVTLSNVSGYRGIVTADAVRFGGGMGNIARGSTLESSKVSGMPRFLEGARYSTQWSGMPYSVYSSKNGINDYGDDINARSYSANYLCGGSAFMPDSAGLNVPIELSLAVHSDAGTTRDESIFGSLSICTTNGNNDAKQFASGVSRLSSFDYATSLLTAVTSDLSATYPKQWTRRELYDRNYSETRNPEYPSAIIETLSHQNFQDMKYGHDPNFKFTLSRALYKATLKFMSYMHDEDYTVQPLPVRNFSLELTGENSVTLSWEATADTLESTATPTGYIVYTAEGDDSFDNGVVVRNQTSFTASIHPDKTYSFRVTAINDGGESFPSETLTAMQSSKGKRTILIVNGFHRLSGPAVIENADSLGFDISSDAGVPYIRTAGFSGKQLCFSRQAMGKEGENELGYSGSEMEGQIIAGNTFDYPADHGKAIAKSHIYSFASCSAEAVNSGKVKLSDYALVDWIAGLERYDSYALGFYKAMPRISAQKIEAYCKGGGRLLISGSFIGSDMLSDSEKAFTSKVLKYQFRRNIKTLRNDSITGLGIHFPIHTQLNSEHYAATHPDCIAPVSPAFSAFAYPDGESAGIAYKGKDYRLIAMGFPFECIKSQTDKERIMDALIRFLMN